MPGKLEGKAARSVGLNGAGLRGYLRDTCQLKADKAFERSISIFLGEEAGRHKGAQTIQRAAHGHI